MSIHPGSLHIFLVLTLKVSHPGKLLNFGKQGWFTSLEVNISIIIKTKFYVAFNTGMGMATDRAKWAME